MDYITELLTAVKNGDVSIDEASLKLKKQPYDDMDFAKVDNHRAVRQGTAEVIYGEGKTVEQIVAIAKKMIENGESNIMATRVSKDVGEQIAAECGGVYHSNARIVVINPQQRKMVGNVVIVSAGTSDLPVCHEARVTAETLGSACTMISDVGVAGIHRLLDKIETIQKARVLIVVAGMEGALASVVGGLVSCPVIAVPTSVGYGASFKGLSALLAMLNSCASGVSVVNIDNGFGAGYLANIINRM
ncbi:MAG: nickel pincer cofactor biosynthesis protein LarB [Bacillota bacterium]